MVDRIEKKLKKEGAITDEKGVLKLKTESYYIKYNPTTKKITVGYITPKGHYAIVSFHQRHITISLNIKEPPEKIAIKIKKHINYEKLIKSLIDEYKTVEEILHENGIELDI